MSDHSAIEWTDATWNPVRGCTKISPGCTHCYAETFAERFRGVPGHPYKDGFDLRLVPDKLSEPLRWADRRTVFVNSMSDLFHDAVPEPYVRAVVAVMKATPWHTYQVLTKRADRLERLLSRPLRSASTLSNAWWGVSVENKKHGLPRISHLQAAPARVRFLSVERTYDQMPARSEAAVADANQRRVLEARFEAMARAFTADPIPLRPIRKTTSLEGAAVL